MSGPWDKYKAQGPWSGFKPAAETPAPSPSAPEQPQGAYPPEIQKAIDAAKTTPGEQILPRLAYQAGGAVTDLAAGHVSPETAAMLGLAANVAVGALPSAIGARMTGGLAEPITEEARRLMTSALKPSQYARQTGKGEQAVETMLKGGYNVTKGGVAKMRTEIDALNAEIKAAIARSPAQVDKNLVAKYADELTESLKKQVNPKADLQQVRQAVKEFLNHPLFTGNTFSVQTAQDLKTGTYAAQRMKQAYGQVKGADVEAQKALARGLKEEIAKAVPGIDKLNARESELLNAETQAVARVIVDQNRNPMSLGWLAMHPSTFLGFAADRSALIKSLLARSLYKGAPSYARTAGEVMGLPAGIAIQQRPKETAPAPTAPNVGGINMAPINNPRPATILPDTLGAPRG